MFCGSVPQIRDYRIVVIRTGAQLIMLRITIIKASIENRGGGVAYLEPCKCQKTKFEICCSRRFF